LSEVQRIVIAGGGTGGHVNPGLAIAQELVRRKARREVRFVGTAAGLEARLVPAAGFALETIRATGIVGKGLLGRAAGLARLPLGLLDAHAILRRFRPALVVGVGGYASGPVLVAALLRRIPTMIHEQNRWPGATNRLLAPWVDRIAVSFETTAGRIGALGTITGNPVRAPFAALPAWTPHAGSARVLVFGGSRGARAVNDAVIAALPRLAASGWSWRHQTGAADRDRVAAAYGHAGIDGARVEAFLDDMPEALAAADLVICRAGASTLAELACAGRAAILIPFPQAAHDHQRHNARGFEAAGAARVLEQRNLDGGRLATEAQALLADPGRIAAMSTAARTLARPDAAARIADLAEALLAPGGAR
jgi:UDP-N-acetylglucosamine--N-acetylmuramyl-(pentapeptide) pyrophosphoryl-undecaprenol N-acetylglucosamine transferase